jgi:anti-sigma factor RsiW
MNHETFKEKLFLHRDGALPPAERPSLEKHLLECVECRAFLAEWERIVEAAFPARDAAAPVGFTDSVMARITEEAPSRALWRRWLHRLGLTQPFGQAAWTGGLALAAALVLWGPAVREKTFAPVIVAQAASPETPLETDFWQDIDTDDESPGLGTGIEEYFL